MKFLLRLLKGLKRGQYVKVKKNCTIDILSMRKIFGKYKFIDGILEKQSIYQIYISELILDLLYKQYEKRDSSCKYCV